MWKFPDDEARKLADSQNFQFAFGGLAMGDHWAVEAMHASHRVALQECG